MNVLLAMVDQVTVVFGCSIHCVAVQLIATVSAVVVPSGATVVSAVTVLAPLRDQGD